MDEVKAHLAEQLERISRMTAAATVAVKEEEEEEDNLEDGGGEADREGVAGNMVGINTKVIIYLITLANRRKK
jgi:hypothetical protein